MSARNCHLPPLTCFPTIPSTVIWNVQSLADGNTSFTRHWSEVPFQERASRVPIMSRRLRPTFAQSSATGHKGSSVMGLSSSDRTSVRLPASSDPDREVSEMLEVRTLDVMFAADEGTCRCKVCDSWPHVSNGAGRLFRSCSGEGHNGVVEGEEERTFSPREGGVFCTGVPDIETGQLCRAISSNGARSDFDPPSLTSSALCHLYLSTNPLSFL